MINEKTGSVLKRSTITGSEFTYSWTPDSSLVNASSLAPIALPLTTTTYILKATTDQGCTAQKAFTVEVVPRISVPNAFTPDGDGKNDVFRAVYGSDISEVRLAVYDRW